MASKAGTAVRLGWIGLGQMGASHVDNLLLKGFDNATMVWNRDSSKCERAVSNGAVLAASPREVVEKSDVTFVMLSTPSAAKAVYKAEDGILAGLTAGKSIVDCASLDDTTMRELEGLVLAQGGRFLASPVAGHSGMAANATCQFICGGDEEVFSNIGGVLDAMGKNKVFVGPDVAAASNMKLVINGLLANITASMSEALAVADYAGLSKEDLSSLISGHAMNSPLLQLCMAKMTSGHHTPPLFMLQHMAKDTRLVCDLAERLGQPTPIHRATRGHYINALEQEGLAEANWTGVFEVVKSKG